MVYDAFLFANLDKCLHASSYQNRTGFGKVKAIWEISYTVVGCQNLSQPSNPGMLELQLTVP